MRPPRPSSLLVLLAAVALSSGACRRDEPADAPPAEPVTAPAPAEAGESAEPEPEPEPEPEEPAGQAEDSEPVSCSQDGDCEGFMRCLDATCQIPPAITGEADESTPWVAFRHDDGEAGEAFARFHVEIADDNPERMRGLMYRRSMKDDWGMLFVFDGEAQRSFWMKNTLIPLDMIFLGADGRVVGVVEGAEPLTLGPRRVEGVSRFVLELNAGRARAVGIGPGDRMEVGNVDEALKPRD